MFRKHILSLIIIQGIFFEILFSQIHPNATAVWLGRDEVLWEINPTTSLAGLKINGMLNSTEVEKRSILEGIITDAFNTWERACNDYYLGKGISFRKRQNSDLAADIQFSFVDMSSGLGNTPCNDEIKNVNIANDPNGPADGKIWTINAFDGDGSLYYDIATTILHEIGHTIIGLCNHTTDNSSVMLDGYSGSRRSLGGIDVNTATNLYNPNTITLLNDYGFGNLYYKPRGSTSFIQVGSSLGLKRPPNATEYLKTESHFATPYFRVFNRFSLSQPATDYFDSTISIYTDHNKLFTASYRKYYTVTINDPISIENGSASYRLNDLPVQNNITTGIIEQNQLKIEAVSSFGSVIASSWKDNANNYYYGNPIYITPSIFPGTHISGLRANIKVHLASNSYSAISNNGQRKLLRDVNGNYHFVYESAGKIFYTTKIGENGSWSNEINLSNEFDAEGFSYRNPTIDVYYETSSLSWKPIVVWEARLSDNSGYLLFGRRISGSSWTSTEDILSSDPVNGAENGNPALAYPYVIFKKGDGFYIVRYSNNSWFDGNSKITGTTAASINPSVLIDRWNGTNITHLVWEENGSVYYRNMSFTGGYSWSSRETVASGDVDVPRSYPSIAMDFDGKIWTTWEFKDEEVLQYRIQAVRRNGANSYGAVSSFGTGIPSSHPYYLRPSISTNVVKNNDLSIAWYKSNNDVQKISYENGAWGSISTLATGKQTPQLITNFCGITYLNKIGFCKASTGSIFALTPIAFSEGGIMEKSSDQTERNQYSRSVITQSDGFVYNVQFGNIRLKQPNGETFKIPLCSLPDTIPLNTLNEVSPFYRSAPFTARDQGEISLQFDEHVMKGKNVELKENDIRYALEFIDNSTGTILYTMNVSTLSEKKKFSDLLSYKFGMTGNKEIFIRLSIQSIGKVSPKFITTNEYSDEKVEGGLNKSGSGNTVIVNFIPKDYSLEQNYPNPFNPTTSIGYALPKDGSITLKVFDMLGKEVAELVNSYKIAGKYSVEFDAGKLSSGMYVYKLTADKFSMSKKLMVVK